MKYEVIIITGTKCGGKSTLARELCHRDSRFMYAKAVTTRSAREDDIPGEYQYISQVDFELLLRDKDALITHATYGNYSYGICRSEIDNIHKQSKIPVMTITPESADKIAGLHRQAGDLTSGQPKYFTVFVDADDSILNDRLELRGVLPNQEVIRQRNRDREFKFVFLLNIHNATIEHTIELLISLWNHSNIGGVLPARLIQLMLQCGTLLEGAAISNVSGASYDLSLGDEYFYRGKIHRLSDSEPILLIEPYDYAIVTSKETANFPNDICARFDLTVSLFCQGVILSNGPQVDPGFQGPLFCLLFNTSSSPVMIKRSQHYATIEFHKLLEPTHSYEGHHRGKRLLHYLPANATQGGISELKKEVEQLRLESSKLREITWAVLTFLLAIIAVWVSLK